MIPSKQSDRNIYIQLLKMHKLPNVLGIIDEMPFSRKLRILKRRSRLEVDLRIRFLTLLPE